MNRTANKPEIATFECEPRGPAMGLRLDNQRFQIQYLEPGSLIPRRNNPRIHSLKQIKIIANSIGRFGFLNPILIDGSSQVIAGHAILEAAKYIHLNRVPTICVAHLSSLEIKALAIALNRSAELAGWDSKFLAIDFQEIGLDETIDVTVTGFETAEIDLIIGGGAVADSIGESHLIDRSAPAISRSGDLYHIGKHRLLCGDALSSASYTALLGRNKAQMVFVDSPYNVPIAGHVSGMGKHLHREFAQASGELSQAQFIDFLGISATRIADSCQDGAIVMTCMDWRHSYELLSAYVPVFGSALNHCVWVKTNGGMGSLYRSQHEFVYVFKKGTKPHINNVQLGKFGRSRTNVWTYAGVNSFGKDRDDELAMHPTVKPVALVADAIMDCSNRGGIILDSFAGSGSTLVAAEKTGRRGYGIELDPYYVDTILRRFEKVYGIAGTHAQSGLTLDELAVQRATHTVPARPMRLPRAATKKSSL